ncbi:hypothetical protein FF1_035292 [Malus domestica]
MENKNSHVLLEEIRSLLLENLSRLQHAPNVQFQERPPDTELPEAKPADHQLDDLLSVARGGLWQQSCGCPNLMCPG